ncbi:hypothetical protein [Amycolatopsis sp. NPDC051371]|uniref:hypothetical protein n=1 Tax=Amycolatopsis sp. NPDC051371 TaxID=3155800 RepID=UPI003414C6AA
MKNTAVVAGIATAFLVLAPGAASASRSPAADAPSEHVGVPKAYVQVIPKVARPGAKVQIRVGCAAEGTHDLTSPALTIGSLRRTGPQNDPATAPAAVASAVVKPVKPGVYPLSFFCGGAEISTKFTLLGAPKQVTKVPAGAPQTGGTDGPADGSGTPLAAAAAMGVLAVGGSGLVLARRVRRR